MGVSWIILGIIILFAVILIFVLIRRNLKDKEEVTKFFIDEEENKREFKSHKDDEV